MFLKRYWSVWWLVAQNALQETFVNRWSNLLFILGKGIRLAVSVIFLVLVKQQVHSFGSYTTDQMIVVYITYQIVDQLSQLVYRGVYLFGNQVRTGEFDFALLKPINPLFTSLTGKPDINDTFFLFPFFATVWWLFSQLSLTITPLSTFWYVVLITNALLISTSLHILILVMGILTTEIDGTVWLLRDLARLGQLPIDVYREPFRFALFFIVPIGFMMTVPAQFLTGAPTTTTIFTICFIGIFFFWFATQAWRYTLRVYTSASS